MNEHGPLYHSVVCVNCISVTIAYTQQHSLNKRAHRALGRSPERTTNVVHQILVEDL